MAETQQLVKKTLSSPNKAKSLASARVSRHDCIVQQVAGAREDGSRGGSKLLSGGTNKCSDIIEVSPVGNMINKRGYASPSISASPGNFISDNDIRRCNLKILNDSKSESETSVKTWNLCKELGVTNSGSEEDMIQQVEELELRQSGICHNGGEESFPMKVFSMNIRGLGGRSKKQKIRSLIRQEHSDFVTI